jgi:hypothetical protein
MPITPDWMITAIIMPAIPRATATLPFVISSDFSIPFVRLWKMFRAK